MKRNLNYNIDEEEHESLYVLEEEGAAQISPEVNADVHADAEDGEDTEYDGQEDAEDDVEEAVSEGRHLSPVRVLFKTMFTPVEGWKSLRRAHFTTEAFASGCFYPLLALAGVSDAAAIFYEPNFGPVDWAMAGLATFLTFFFGYFTALVAGGIILPKRSRDFLKKDVGKQFMLLCFSTLTLFWTAIKLLPMLEPVLVFLPLWTIYLVYKGVRVMRIPEDCRTSTTGLLCMLIIGAPLLWDWLAEIML